MPTHTINQMIYIQYIHTEIQTRIGTKKTHIFRRKSKQTNEKTNKQKEEPKVLNPRTKTHPKIISPN